MQFQGDVLHQLTTNNKPFLAGFVRCPYAVHYHMKRSNECCIGTLLVHILIQPPVGVPWCIISVATSDPQETLKHKPSLIQSSASNKNNVCHGILTTYYMHNKAVRGKKTARKKNKTT